MDWDVKLAGIFIDFFVARGHDRVPTEKVDCHPLDRAHIDEGVPRLGISQVRTWENSRVELLILIEISSLESLAVNLINLVELQSRLWVKGSNRQHRLCSEYAAINQEENPLGDTRLHQPIDLIDHREGLARSGCHGHEHLMLALSDCFLNGSVCLPLVGTEAGMVVSCLEKSLTRGIEILSKLLG